jgi:hypothetical protein
VGSEVGGGGRRGNDAVEVITDLLLCVAVMAEALRCSPSSPAQAAIAERRCDALAGCRSVATASSRPIRRRRT